MKVFFDYQGMHIHFFGSVAESELPEFGSSFHKPEKRPKKNAPLIKLFKNCSGFRRINCLIVKEARFMGFLIRIFHRICESRKFLR